MKYAIVIPDGAADDPLEDLGGRTPLTAAKTPNMDWIAANGKIGTVCNIPKAMPCGSDVAILSVIGYEPSSYYTGRAPLEAAAQGIEVGEDEWIFRCNFVTIIDGIMEDYSAGHISTEEAAVLINDLNARLGSESVRFYSGVSYRHLMTFTGEVSLKTIPPHDIQGKRASSYLPAGRGEEKIRDIMERAAGMLRDHEINKVRDDLGESLATSIWLWGEGKMPQLDSFSDRFGIDGAVITGVDLVRGIAKLIGWDVIEVEGATGYIDTNYVGKGQSATEALDRYDLVFVHVEAPDEAGHNANVTGKVEAIEKIDKHIVGPLLSRLKAGDDGWRIMVLPDHPTPCTVRTHTFDPVPFAVAGTGIEAVVSGEFNEDNAAASDLHVQRGCELMEYFLTVR